jgi:hypothetical protein
LWTAILGYALAMSDDRTQAESDEADPEKMSSPVGVARDLEAKADEMGGTTDPAEVEDDEIVDEIKQQPSS